MHRRQATETKYEKPPRWRFWTRNWSGRGRSVSTRPGWLADSPARRCRICLSRL